jgi:hypothetical protein
VPDRSSADRTHLTGWQQGALIVAVLVAAGIAATIAMRRWRRARRAEHLSDDPRLGDGVDALLAGAAAPIDPVSLAPLEVTTAPPVEMPNLPLVPVTATTNMFTAAPWTIVYLRLFDNDARLREVLAGPWTACGRVELMRAATSVSDEEIERARSGEPMFINSREWLQRVLDADNDPLPPGTHEYTGVASSHVRVRSPLGSYPPRALLVHGSFWQEALETLLDRADVVLLDLSGYCRENVGTGYEIQRIVDRWPIERCLLLLDAESDATFLEAQLRDAWSRMAATSPNARGAHRMVMCRTGRGSDDEYAVAASLQMQLSRMVPT